MMNKRLNQNQIQYSVSMAYFLGPLLGGEIAQYIGFSSLMSIIGLLNVSYAIYLMLTVLHIFQPKVCTYSTVKNPIQYFSRLYVMNVLCCSSFFFFFFRNTTWMVHWRKINHFHCICGQTVPVLRCHRIISDSMIQSMNAKIEKNIDAQNMRNIMPIKFQFHAWLSNYNNNNQSVILSVHLQQQ